jgi:tetratricopeptide (TPR) repeat protein
MMKIISMTLLLVISSLAFATIADGDKAIDAGDYQEAIKQYSAALASQPENVNVLYKLAKAKTYFAESLTGAEAEAMYSEAAEHARVAISLAPDRPETHMELARALGRLAQFKGVLQSLGLAAEVKGELEKAIQLDPSYAAALHALALWNLEVPWIAGGRTGQVRPLFDQAIAAEPNEIVHYVDYADALIRLDDKVAAKIQLEAALALSVESYRDQQDQEKAQRMLSELGE